MAVFLAQHRGVGFLAEGLGGGEVRDGGCEVAEEEGCGGVDGVAFRVCEVGLGFGGGRVGGCVSGFARVAAVRCAGGEVGVAD